jgi:hypothetical protein
MNWSGSSKKDEKTAEDRAAVSRLLEEFRQVHQHRLDLEHDMALRRGPLSHP